MQQDTDSRSTALVVGAGQVELMAVIIPAKHGLRSTVVERVKTRHGALTPRSLKICRLVGLEVETMKRRGIPTEVRDQS